MPSIPTAYLFEGFSRKKFIYTEMMKFFVQFCYCKNTLMTI